MTDAHEKLRAAIDEVWKPGFYEAYKRHREEVDAILSTLKLTPAAAAALMDGTAVVVPVEPADDQIEEIADAGVYFTVEAYRRALAASPYRSNSDAGV